MLLFIATVLCAMSATVGSYGIGGLIWIQVLVGIVAVITGVCGVLASKKQWWSVILLLCVVQSALFFAFVAVSVVAFIWASGERKSTNHAGHTSKKRCR